MHRHKRNIIWLFVAIVFLSILGWFTNSFLPDSPVLITVFFILVAGSIFSLLHLIFGTIRQPLLFCLAGVGILILRYFGLKDILYTLLFLACIGAVEYFLRQ